MLPASVVATSTCSATMLWGSLNIRLPTMTWAFDVSTVAGTGLRCELAMTAYAWPGGLGWMAMQSVGQLRRHFGTISRAFSISLPPHKRRAMLFLEHIFIAC